jgi:hypothetical protein
MEDKKFIPFFQNNWRTMQECNDQVNLEWFIFIVLYKEMLYIS